MSTHTDTELIRLDAGVENCGCPECQRFYKTIDLSKYGGRVKTFGDVIIINAKSPKPLKPSLELLGNAADRKQGRKNRVVKIVTGKMTPPELCNKPVIDCSAPLFVKNSPDSLKGLKRRGRPEKFGDVNRTTLWRRAKKLAKQQTEKLL